jgi:hypothetical protein
MYAAQNSRRPLALAYDLPGDKAPPYSHAGAHLVTASATVARKTHEVRMVLDPLPVLLAEFTGPKRKLRLSTAFALHMSGRALLEVQGQLGVAAAPGRGGHNRQLAERKRVRNRLSSIQGSAAQRSEAQRNAAQRSAAQRSAAQRSVWPGPPRPQRDASEATTESWWARPTRAHMVTSAVPLAAVYHSRVLTWYSSRLPLGPGGAARSFSSPCCPVPP